MSFNIIQLKQDRNARNTAVPFRGSIWGFPYTDGAERSLNTYDASLSGINIGNYDTYNLVGQGANSPAQVNPIRILQPHYGTIVECFCDFSAAFSSTDNGMGCYLAIGTYANTSTFTPNTTYSQSYLDASWLKINGKSSYLTVSGSALAPQTLNLLPALYTSSDAAFVEEAFVLLLCFTKPPFASGFQLKTLNIHMSVQGIV